MDNTFRQRAEEYLDQPFEVSLETLSLCNAACEFCPYPTVSRRGTRMPDELIDRLVDEMATFERPFFLAPFKLNEPLLDKRLIPLCERVNRDVPNATLKLFTNGSALAPDKVEGAARLRNVAYLWVSLNAHEPDEYERVMRMSFERTAKRLDGLHASGFSHPVILSAVARGEPHDEAFRFYCFQRWPKFTALVIKRDAWLGYTEAGTDIVPDAPCSRWLELSVMATGKVAHCCMDSGEDPRWTIGDLTRQTMREVYNAPLWRERRERLLSRKQLDDRSPCAGCTY